jgi:hypothetical protein
VGGVSLRALVAVLVVQLLLAGLLIWAAASGFSFLHGLLDSGQGARSTVHAAPAP